MSVVHLRSEEPPRAALAPPARLAHLARSDDPAQRLSAALSRWAPAESLECLVADTDVRVRQAVAANPASPLRTLGRLADDADVEVRSALAATAPTIALRAKLLHDTSPAVKATLLGWHGRRCEGRSLDPEAAAAALMLCGDADSDVTAAAARMRSADAATPPAELAELAAHPDDEARRNAAAHPRCPTETVGRLAGDPCWAVAFAALDNSRCPHAARDAAAGDVYACSLRAEHHKRAEGAPHVPVINDPNRAPVYDAERRWRAAARSKQTFGSAENAAGFVRSMLADPLLRTRYGAVCEQLQSSTMVRFDTKLQMFAGRSEGTEIKLHPKAARPEVLLHEIAHLIVRNDPRLALLPHPPEPHGPEFVAVMLDLAETLHGSVERDQLREIYRTEGAQMLAERPLSSGLHPGRSTELVPAVAPVAAGRPRGPPPAATKQPAVKLCGRIVKRTRRRCMLARGHRGRCRSTLPHHTGSTSTKRRRSRRRR